MKSGLIIAAKAPLKVEFELTVLIEGLVLCLQGLLVLLLELDILRSLDTVHGRSGTHLVYHVAVKVPKTAPDFAN